VDSRPRLPVTQDAGRLVRQLDAGPLAEAEAAQPGVVAVAAQPIADLRGTDVAGELDDLGEREPAVRVGVVDGPLPDVVRAGLAEEALRRRDHVILERARREDRLERRAGLVRVGDGVVADAVLV